MCGHGHKESQSKLASLVMPASPELMKEEESGWRRFLMSGLVHHKDKDMKELNEKTHPMQVLVEILTGP